MKKINLNDENKSCVLSSEAKGEKSIFENFKCLLRRIYFTIVISFNYSGNGNSRENMMDLLMKDSNEN